MLNQLNLNMSFWFVSHDLWTASQKQDYLNGIKYEQSL